MALPEQQVLNCSSSVSMDYCFVLFLLVMIEVRDAKCLFSPSTYVQRTSEHCARGRKELAGTANSSTTRGPSSPEWSRASSSKEATSCSTTAPAATPSTATSSQTKASSSTTQDRVPWRWRVRLTSLQTDRDEG
jgi:hypothetical protein